MKKTCKRLYIETVVCLVLVLTMIAIPLQAQAAQNSNHPVADRLGITLFDKPKKMFPWRSGDGNYYLSDAENVKKNRIEPVYRNDELLVLGEVNGTDLYYGKWTHTIEVPKTEPWGYTHNVTKWIAEEVFFRKGAVETRRFEWEHPIADSLGIDMYPNSKVMYVKSIGLSKDGGARYRYAYKDAKKSKDLVLGYDQIVTVTRSGDGKELTSRGTYYLVDGQKIWVLGKVRNSDFYYVKLRYFNKEKCKWSYAKAFCPTNGLISKRTKSQEEDVKQFREMGFRFIERAFYNTTIWIED